MNGHGAGRHGRRRAGRPAILAFSGPSGAGKTSLLVKLIPALVARGLSVAALKRSGHPHPFDRPGKDSARLRQAGAVAVALQGPAELAWFGPPLPGGPEALVQLLPEVDLVVAEGFKDASVPRVEIHRDAVARRFLCERDPRVVAVVSDREPPRPLPWFAPAEVEALAEFVARFTDRERRPRKRALASSRAHAHRVPGRHTQPREKLMARKTKTSRSPRAAAGRSRSGSRSKRRTTKRRSGGATVREAGRKGGRRTLERRGPEFYSRIGRKGGKSSGTSRRSAARGRGGSRSRTGRGGRAGTRRKSSR